MTHGTGREMMLLIFFYRFLIALTSLPKLELRSGFWLGIKWRLPSI